MSLCPNKEAPEWKALVEAVGTFEAYRDWMENNYTVRDPETVALKLVSRGEISPLTRTVRDIYLGKSLVGNLPEEQVRALPKVILTLIEPLSETIWKKAIKGNWDDEKLRQELKIPAEQWNLKSKSYRDFLGPVDLALDIYSSYSYAVEINTALRNINTYDGKPLTKEQIQNIGEEPIYGEYRLEISDTIRKLSEQGRSKEEILEVIKKINNIDGEYLYFNYPDFEPEYGDDIPPAPTDYNENIQYVKDNYFNISKSNPTQYYANLTVPGGTNYIENEIAVPAITPSIKGHAQFATDNGIGWFRSDDKANLETGSRVRGAHGTSYSNQVSTKIRRILEIQSDLFQKGRNKSILVKEGNPNDYPTLWKHDKEQNNFLQLLNKDNNWVTFFIKSIIQDSIKKGYEKVLFPLGDTASKVEGHQVLADFKAEREERLAQIEKNIINAKKSAKYNSDKGKDDIVDNIMDQIKQYEHERVNVRGELERLETQGLAALRPVYKFYEETIQNILKKNGYDPEEITDEFGNKWNLIKLNPVRDLSVVAYSRTTPLGILKEELGLYKKEISDLQKNKLLKRLGKYNALHGTAHSIDFAQVGQANLYTWNITERWNGYNPTQLTMFQRELLDSPRGADGYLTQLPFTLDPKSQDTARANEIAKKLLEALTDHSGVDYLFVSPEEARSLTEGSNSPWKGEKAFFAADTIYLVGDHLTTKTVFHEFSHPLMRTLWMKNKAVFDRLYDNLSATEEGREIISETSELYPEFPQESNLFKEEVLVRALTKKAENLFNNKVSPKFDSVIDKILYHIKQLLRRVFKAPIKPEKLDVNTTLDQLAEMLTNERFKIDTKAISLDDVNSFIREQKQQIEDLKKVPDMIQPFIDQLLKSTSEEPVRALQRLDDQKMLDLLKNDVGTDLLRQMRGNISKFSSEIRRKTQEKIDETKLLNEQAEAFIGSLFVLKDTLSNLADEMLELKNSPQDKDSLIRAQYITEFGKYWNEYLKDVDSKLASRGVSEDSALRQLILQAESHINKGIARHADPIFKAGLTTLISETLMPMAKRYEEVHKQTIARLTAKNAPANLIKAEEDEFKRLEISPEKISAMLNGWEDASRLNTWLEPWMYSSDLVVGGFAAFLKNALNDVLSNSYTRWNNFVSEITPLLKNAGYDPTKISSLAEKITFVDGKGYVEQPDGTMKKLEVYTFLNPYKDYRYVLAKFDHDITEADKKEDKTDYDKLVKERDDLDRWFWREYVDEFYEKDEIFRTPIGQIAKQRRDEIFYEINGLWNKIITEQDHIELSPQIDALWKRYKRLSSLKDLNDEYKTGEDLEIAKVLQEYKEVARHLYHYKEKKGLFQGRLSTYEQSLFNQGLAPESKEFQDKRQQWIDNNTVIAVTPEFYAKTGEVFDKIKAIYEQASKNAEGVELAAVYKDIRDTLSGYRDDDGQPTGTDMSNKTLEKIKTLQERADVLRKVLRTGLTDDENFRLGQFFQALKAGTRLTIDEQNDFDDLLNKGPRDGLNKFQRAELNGLWAELSDLQGKIPTEYYLDIMNNFLSKANTKAIEDLNKKGYITNDTADYVINLPEFQKLLKADAKFKEWFERSHIRRDFYDEETKTRKKRWERTAAWSVVRPHEAKYLETTTVQGTDGKPTTIIGKPSLRFYRREVRPEFHTKKITGVTKDIKGNWLPKSQAQGAPDDRFINHEYFRIKNEDPAMFALLEKIKEHYISMQEGADSYAQLGFDIPRFRKKGLEVIQTPGYSKEKINSIQGWWRNVKAVFSRRKDDPDEGYNPDDEVLLAGDDFYESRRQPVSGIYNLDIKDVSQDILAGMARYMSGIERQKKLKEIHPLAKALQTVLNDPENAARDMSRVNSKNFKYEHAMKLPRKNGKYVRASAVDNLIDREFYGQHYTGLFADNKAVNSITNKMFNLASFSYLAVQLPSAVTNMLVQMTQNAIESAAGAYINPQDLAYGTWKGTQVNTQIAMEIYKVGSHSLEVQLVELMDAIPGRTQQRMGTNLSRTLLRDSVGLSYLYSPRKFLENEATLQAFFAMMHHQKVEQVINGQVKEIPYDEAWEIKDGKITLKEGIDKSYAPGGTKFNEIRNRQEIIQYKMNGAYDSFGQPEAQRYLVFRLFSFLRRYVTTMMTNRWGFTRHNPGMMDVQTGYYIEALKAFWSMLKTGGKYINMMKPSEAQAFRRLFTELGILTLMSFAYGMLFGWDPNDDDKYEKLRAKSGPLPALGVADSGYPFQWGGWMSNHLLLQLMKTQAQTQMWIPTPGMGLKDYTDLGSVTPVLFGPTINLYSKLIDDVMMMSRGDDRAYYQKDIGPYVWQQQDELKFWNHLGSAFGLRGVTVDPILGVQKTQSMQVKR